MIARARRLTFLWAAIFTAIVVWPRCVHPLDPHTPIGEYLHDTWSTEDGLPVSTVLAVIQAPDRYLWAATEAGIVRFDGLRFTLYDRSSTPPLPGNDATSLAAGRRGSIWVGDALGVSRYGDGRFERIAPRAGAPSLSVSALAVDDHMSAWIGTKNGGVWRLQNGELAAVGGPAEASGPEVTCIHLDRDGEVWVGSAGGGLRAIGEGQIATYTIRDGLPSDTVQAVCRDGTGRLWVGTESGLSYFENGRFVTLTTEDGLSRNWVTALHADRNGNLWIGTRGGGLNRLHDRVFSALRAGSGLSSDMVRAVFEDHEGNLWVGTGSGLDRLKDATFSVYTVTQGLSNDEIWSIYEDDRGAIWIGTYGGGMNVLEGSRVRRFSTREGLADNIVNTTLQSRDGSLWIGTSNGLSRYRDGRFESYTKKNGLVSNSIRALCEDRRGRLWVGTYDGVCISEPDRPGLFVAVDGLTQKRIAFLHEDAGGAIWAGTTCCGLMRWQDGTIRTYTTRDGLPTNELDCLYEGSDGTFWIGTYGGGLVRMSHGRFFTYSTRHGLYDDVVFSILEDDKGRLWMSCNKGVFSASLAELNDIAAGRSSRLRCASYGKTDGLRNPECNGGFPTTAWKTRDGRLWFATMEGAAVVDPARMRRNAPPPSVVLEDLVADATHVDLTGEVRLPPGTEKLELRYTALSLASPDKVRFRYRLDGYDTEWVDAGSRRTAFYTHLPAGAYRFSVTAGNRDDVWSEQGATVGFFIRPFYYRTPWFYALCVVTLTLLATGLYATRVRHMKAKFAAVLAERQRIAREIHDTLAQGLTGISVQLEGVAETLLDDPPVAQRHLDRARTLVRTSLADARGAVWNLVPEALRGRDLVQALLQASRLPAESSEARVDVAVSGTPYSLPSRIEANLLRIGQEALSNALKHSRCRNVRVAVGFEKGAVRLSVKDDGCGFDAGATPPDGRPRFGLRGMEERAKLIRGTLSVRTNPGAGTEVDVCVPIG
ncbi:MAG: hypothetical protein HYX75_11545 [Acidobacteria bacterium]|nr:hypothetical protein [Acidobacteriota bacterium]